VKRAELSAGLSRRALLQAAGALIVTFSLPSAGRAQTPRIGEDEPVLPGQVAAPGQTIPPGQIDAWLAIAPDSGVTLYTGKVELGTGVATALAQIVAEELDVAVRRITVVQGDTARTPDQGITAGSKTIQRGASIIRQAAADARYTLRLLASVRLSTSVDQLATADGVVSVIDDPSRRATYGELVGGRRFSRPVTRDFQTKPRAAYTVVGAPVPRLDIPAKVAGTHVYVQDLRVPGMLHGRVVRPRAVGAGLAAVDEGSVRELPGVVRVVREGDFVGVVCEREEQAITAARALKVTWRGGAHLPAMAALHDALVQSPSTPRVLVNRGDVDGALKRAAAPLDREYRWPYQMHASIGPSCGVADVRKDGATVWTASQGVFDLRGALAGLLGLPAERIRAIFVEGSGCYGHNGADDAAADAAILSRAVGRPVRVQWMRHDEHGHEPKGPAMVMRVRGALDADRHVTAWDYAVWTPTHTRRPAGRAGNLLAGEETGALEAVTRVSGGDRNAQHGYAFPSNRVVVHELDRSPLRVSALRGLGAPANTFANESFVDELAAAAGADPVEFRLRHLGDPRAVAVIRAAARAAGWTPRPAPAPGARSGGPAVGRGIAYCQYENENAYVAAVVEVEVSRDRGAIRVRRVAVAHDCGLVVNPDGVRNQIEGNVLQAISRTLKEAVQFDAGGVTSLDWSAYPILTFAEAPDAVEIVLVDPGDKPPVGAGEPATCPIPAAIANAVFDATGVRLRTVPFTAERVREELARS
jgi:CO/xanthine dehydrogenase Mo-binding subunit